MMNLEDIKGLMQEFDRSSIHKMTLELENITLKLERKRSERVGDGSCSFHFFLLPQPLRRFCPLLW